MTHAFSPTLTDGFPRGRPSPTVNGAAAITNASGTTNPVRRLKTTCMADVQRENARHLWPRRLLLGKVAVVAGMQGLGKSMLTLDIAARITTGTPWPDSPSEPNPVGSVVLLTAEDDLKDTIRPRLEDAGADMLKIHAVEGTEVPGKVGVDHFDIAGDVHRLHELIEELGDVRLVIIDPITAYMGADCDIHRDNSVRSVLAPLANLAAKHGVAVVCVMHLRKSGSDAALYRVLGSVAFTALARSVWMVGQPPDTDDPAARVFACSKMNLCKAAQSLNFSIIEPGRVAWGESSELTADEIFAAAASGHPDESGPAVSDAMAFLREALADGACKAKDVKKDARENSIAERTLSRAKSKLGIESNKEGFQGVYYWRLPAEADAADGGAND